MHLTQSASVSLEILSAHKGRTALSVLGLVVGVGAVVLMVAAGRGAQERLLRRIRDMGTNLIIVSAGQTRVIAGRKRQMGTVTTLVPADARGLRARCPHVRLAAAGVAKKQSVRAGTEDAATNVVGLDLAALEIRNIRVASGRAPDRGEVRGSRRVALLGPTVARNLFGGEDPVGQRIRIGRVPFRVIGVTAPKGTDVNGTDQDDLIIVPVTTAMRRLFHVTYVDTIYVQATSADALSAAEREIRQALRRAHRLGGKPDDFTIQNQATLLQTERETSQAMIWLVAGAAGISLLVGGVGILAVMLMSVRERTAEIGLRRALGARRRDIRNQFLLEAALLSAGGGLLGIALGTGSAWLVDRLGYWQTLLSWPSALASLVFSVGIGMLFGIFPAVRAAQLEPIEALRAE